MIRQEIYSFRVILFINNSFNEDLANIIFLKKIPLFKKTTLNFKELIFTKFTFINKQLSLEIF